MKTLIDVVAVFALFGGLVFMATYHLTAPWWRSPTGVNMMGFTGSVTALFGLRGLALVFGEGYPGQDFARLLIFAVIGGLVWHRWTLLVRVQVGSCQHEHHRADPAA